MKWQRGLGALLLIIGITVAFLPFLQHAYGYYSQWRLEREFEAQMQEAQGQAMQSLAQPSLEEWMSRFFSVRTAHAATAAPATRTTRKGRAATLVSSTSRRRAATQSRHKGAPRMGLVRIEIPRLNVRAIVVEGTTNAQLARGPAHFKGTALPGQQGNCAIAGHRNMYGSWFKNLNQLRAGDQIILRTPQKTFTYKVTQTKIVLSKDTSVLRPTKDATLTLVTCMIPYAKHRLIVFGKLV